MKVKIRYATEIGGTNQIINIKEIPKFAEKFTIISVSPLKKKRYTKKDMINASKYGYNFHKTTQFPEQDFEESCINNTQQWLTTI